VSLLLLVLFIQAVDFAFDKFSAFTIQRFVNEEIVFTKGHASLLCGLASDYIDSLQNALGSNEEIAKKVNQMKIMGWLILATKWGVIILIAFAFSTSIRKKIINKQY